MSAQYRPPILGHISLGVRNYESAKAFYTAVLAPLGVSLVYESQVRSPTKSSRTLGFGPDENHEILNLFERDDAHSSGQGFHIAFNAPSKAAIVEFHTAATRYGGTNNGEPGVRVRYGANYFAAIVFDPEGWKLEAVCKNEEV